MRFTTAYYLLLLYSLVMFKPLMPLVSDVLSHVFAEAIHIATVHAKYGSHHLEKELAKTAGDNSKNHNAVLSEENLTVHISTNEYSYYFYSGRQNKNYPVLKLHNIEDIFISKQVPPPKFS
jgi:hypothetical protein